VVTPDGVHRVDLAIKDGVIVELSANLPSLAREDVNAHGLHVFPGVIDAHVHFNEPGRIEWEGFDTGSAAFAAGGGTCFFEMPLNASPPTLDGESFDRKLDAALAHSRTDFALWGGLTPTNLDELDVLAERGVVGFKAFMSDSGIDDFQRADDWTLLCGMKAAARLGLPVAVHAESEELTQGKTAWMKSKHATLEAKDWVYTREPLAEIEAIKRAMLFAGTTKCALHVVHVSNRKAVEVAATAHDRSGINVSVETCPHYFMLQHADVIRLGVIAKCAPPIRVAPHPDQLWDAVGKGLVNTIGSDHSPSPHYMKIGKSFMDAWGGIAGVQSTLPSLLTREPKLPLERIAALTAGNVAERFNLPAKGQIARDFDADLALVDLNAEYELTRDMLLDRHKLSPYVGRRFRGQVKRTIVRGHTVFQDGKATSDFRGRLVRPMRSPSPAAAGARHD
jgi:allantoinase